MSLGCLYNPECSPRVAFRFPLVSGGRLSIVFLDGGRTTCGRAEYCINVHMEPTVKLRPHMGLRVLTTIGPMAWNQKGTKGNDPQLAALEWSNSMDRSK